MAGMKYIKFDYAGFIIFDKSQKHSEIAKKFPNDTVLSAGFVEMSLDTADQVGCYGESTSLNKKSEKGDREMLFRRLSLYAY